MVFFWLVFHCIILLRAPDSGAVSCEFYRVSPPAVVICSLFLNLHNWRTTGRIALTKNNNSRINLTRGKKIILNIKYIFGANIHNYFNSSKVWVLHKPYSLHIIQIEDCSLLWLVDSLMDFWHLLMALFADTKRTYVAKCYHMLTVLIRGCF